MSIEDLSEEVVGEFDAGVPRPPEAYRDSLGYLHVSGTMRLDEVGEQLDVALAHD